MGRLLQCQSGNKATVCMLYRDSSKSQYCMHDRISIHELTIVETLCCFDDVFCNVGVLRFSMNEGDNFSTSWASSMLRSSDGGRSLVVELRGLGGLELVG